MRNYLLTGASGFLGKIITNTLSEFSIVRMARSDGDMQLDLAREIPDFNRHFFTTVLHASGKAHVIPKAIQQQQEFYDVNYQGTVNLTKGLEQLAVLPKAFVFISTVAVYGREEGVGIDETHPLNGTTPYAKSKIQAEEFLKTWCAKHSVVLTILRLPLIVGVNPPGNLGAMTRLIKSGLYVGIGSGNVRKSMVLAEDVARFIPVVKSIGGTYNLTDGHHPTMAELDQAIAKQVKKRTPFRLPNGMLKLIARFGDLLGDKAPLNTLKFRKLTSSLTFSDAKARGIGWRPRQVIKNLPPL